MDRRPQFAVSPRRLRPRRALRPIPSDQTPPGYKKSPFRSEYEMISSELIHLAKRVKEQFRDCGDLGKALDPSKGCYGSPLFERGRFYDLYSARRNERLKRKKGEIAEEIVTRDPAVAVELSKRRSGNKVDGLRKSVPSNFSVTRASTLRSSVRSSKEMKKPTAARSYLDPGKLIGTRTVRRSMN